MNRLSILYITLFLYSCTPQQYHKDTGLIFGTSYHITYKNDKDIEGDIRNVLLKFSNSLSTFDSTSTISRINRNDSTVVLDSFFVRCFNKGYEISELTSGAFDMTVARLVNVWGFGFDESEKADSSLIDSLLRITGYKKIKLINGKIVKENPGIMLDASAIAKGYGVDIASEYLEHRGINNYMVEIGGEVRVKGKNPKGQLWRIAIDKPIDDALAMHHDFQAIVSLNNKALATSGNYRQFYIKDGVKYAHTINPKSGYPARNKMLSTTVLANNCMTADALATSFMVMGVDNSISLANKLNNIEVYFIYSDSISDKYNIYVSDGFKKILDKKR